MDFHGRLFVEGEEVRLDGNRYYDCVFAKGCILRYEASAGVTIVGCDIHTETLSFGGQAAETLHFLRGLRDAGFRDLPGLLFGPTKRLD